MPIRASKPLSVQTLETEDQLSAAVAELGTVEPRFLSVIQAHGVPPLRRNEGGLAGLLGIVTGQMISLLAAGAIWRRLQSEFAPFNAEVIAGMETAQLMKLGLSGAKARTFIAVAERVASGKFDFAQLGEMTDTEARTALIALPGIGPWTAELYLLTALGRCDAWPAGDLALQVSAQALFGLDARPDGRLMDRLAEPWQPWRAVAARLLWSHYRGLRGWPATLA